VLDEDSYVWWTASGSQVEPQEWAQFVRRSQKNVSQYLPELCGAKSHAGACAIPNMFKDSHPQLFNIAGSKEPCRDNTLRAFSRAKAPRLCGAPLDKNDCLKAVEIIRRFRRAVSREVLRSGDENQYRLRELSGNQCRVWKDRQSGSPNRSRLR